MKVSPGKRINNNLISILKRNHYQVNMQYQDLDEYDLYIFVLNFQFTHLNG